MHVLGDVYDIAKRVKEYDPTYELYWNPHIKRYQVLANKRALKEEGVLDGHPLYFMHDYSEIVFTWDVEGMAPDMRIIWHLYETDVWRYPGGPAAFYDDMMRDTETRKQKRDEDLKETVEYVANEHAPVIFDTKKSFHMGTKAV